LLSDLKSEVFDNQIINLNQPKQMSGDNANMQASAKQVWGAADTAAGWSTGTTFTTADKGKATSWAGSASKFSCIKMTDSTPTTDCNI